MSQIQLWNEDTWKKLRKRIDMPMPYSGNPKFGNSATRVQFDRLNVDVLVVHETFIVIFNATKHEFIVQVLLLPLANCCLLKKKNKGLT